MTGNRAAPGSDHLDASVLDTLGVVVIVTEFGSGAVVALNEAARDLTGFTTEEVLGRPIWDTVLAGRHGEQLKRCWDDLTGESLSAVRAGVITTKDGHDRRVAWSLVPVQDGGQAPAYVVMTGIQTTTDDHGAGLLNHLMLAATDAACVATDLRGRVTFMSSGAEQMLGRTAEDALGALLPEDWFDPIELGARAEALGVSPALAVLQLEDGQRDRRRRERLDLGTLDRRGRGRVSRAELPPRPNGPPPREWTLVREDGSRFTATITVHHATSGKRQVGYLALLDDVTERDRTHAFLVAMVEKDRVAAEQLRELSNAKDRLVETVSHEFRTPVASMAGFVELLQDGVAGSLNADQAKFVGAIARSGERLRTLTDDLLMLAGLESRAATVQLARMDLREVMAEVSHTMRRDEQADWPDLTFAWPDHAVEVSGDATRLEWMVRQLVSNAVKFSPDGGTVACELGVDQGDAVVAVRDTGIGIPEDERAGLFAPFFRASSALDRHIQGAGLGLSIVASIVEGHGGEIAMTPNAGQGTVMTVRLALAAPGPSV